MEIEQFVMAYGVEQDRLRAILPEGFISLRPVLRINAEIADGTSAYIEFNTAVEHDGKKGWLNIWNCRDIRFFRDGASVRFCAEHLEISFTAVGINGSCPAEKDNDSCWFLPDKELRPPEIITSDKEFCDCEFRWDYGAKGKSIGKTLPAVPTEMKTAHPKADFTVGNAASIPCEVVLGTYTVRFERRNNYAVQ